MKMLTAKLDRYMEEALFYYDLPGLAASVVSRKDGLDYKSAVGYQDWESREPLEADHIFHMASVSKLFTSTGILQLCKAGKLRLDSRLKDVLPELKIADKRWEEVTIRHMLTHTSGLADVEDYHWETPRMDEAALRDYSLSEEVRQSALLWSPSEGKFRYSNMAYELLGRIIEVISGMPFEEYMECNLLEPLGMRDSTFLTFSRADGSLSLDDLKKKHMAMPHRKNEEKHIVKELHYPYNREHGPSSTLTSNLQDLSRWAEAHIRSWQSVGEEQKTQDKNAAFAGRLFDASDYDKIWHSYATVPNNKEEMGLGWFMRKQRGLRLYGHEGTDDGFRASFWLCPEEEIHIIVVSDLSGAPVKKINKKLLDLLLEERENRR